MTVSQWPRIRSLAPFTLLLGLLLGLPAWACLNHYGKLNIHGEPVTPGESPDSYHSFISRLSHHPLHDAIVASPSPAEPAAGADFKARSDYAFLLVHRGESRKAAQILEAVEQEHPGEYIVAANLGTAYELSGDLEKAHHWIGEGIRRDPKSHEESEWLHLKILEARQALAKDPDWAKSHGVLDLDFGQDAIPRKPATWPREAGDAEHVIRSLSYQLGERLAFVPPPDALVAGMIADLADLLALYRSVDHAIPVYELALKYRPLQADLVAKRLASSLEMRQTEARKYGGDPQRTQWQYQLIGVAVIALLVAGLWWIWKGAGAR